MISNLALVCAPSIRHVCMCVSVRAGVCAQRTRGGRMRGGDTE